MNPASALHIRRSTAADVDALLSIAQTCFGASAWGAAHFAPYPARVTLVADTVVQACVGYTVLEFAADQAELQAIAVLPAFRRQHVGTELMQAGLQLTSERGVQTIFLEVRQSNLLAQDFYRRFGFAPVGRRPGYYHLPDEAALIMSAPQA